MNKKQMLKEQKRIKQERKESEKMFRNDNGMSDSIKIAIGVLLFIGLCFVAVNIAKGNWNLFNKNNRPSTEISTNMVIVGTMFNKEDGEYLVLAYDMQGVEKDLYGYLGQNYRGNDHLYYLDLSSGFNSNFIGDNSNIVNDLSLLKLSGPTLLVINKDQITASYNTEDAIIEFLNSK